MPEIFSFYLFHFISYLSFFHFSIIKSEFFLTLERELSTTPRAPGADYSGHFRLPRLILFKMMLKSRK